MLNQNWIGLAQIARLARQHPRSMKIHTSREMLRKSYIMRLNLYFRNIMLSMNLVPMRGGEYERQRFCKPDMDTC